MPSPTRLLSLSAALFLTLLLAAGCGSSSKPAASSSSPRAAGGADVIVIKNFGYHPGTLTVAPGAMVTVMNEDTATHTVTATAPHPAAFDTGDVSPGGSETFKAPTTPGTYPYICTIHQFMHGTLVVS